MSQAKSVIYIDVGGRATIHLIRSDTGAGTILNVLLGHSNADVSSTWEGTEVVNSTPSPVSAQYATGNIVAQLTFLAADGTLATINIPAPKIDIFLADQSTVDPSTITDLITACVGQLIAPSGSLAVSYVSGVASPVKN